ncbi:fumarylacetoacetate hydrolase family protein [Paraburkholderia sp. SARCC-3016]|uniref:fumarylacetoacetate hydrolase family protein n=1 Tax=Paraburkholderia sp. SARCC-3016 TaxID=3058611 RepID=UPI00280680DE|nr:fumarylacetoacetate hydrolase family protein [Paraburkholderia sp. SARCC-3016]MDQ7982305.1 fumarylacetoacetate hydrolase family protein [Paraburkholderia sp. SARCC-3016]
MKLFRYGPVGHERPGIIDANGAMRSLYPVVREIDDTVLSPEGLNFLRALDASRLPEVPADTRIGVPLSSVRGITAIGLNYTDHAREANMAIPTEPVVFSKATSSLAGPNDDILLPARSEKTDWEVELAIVIGSTASNLSLAQAHSAIAGFCLVNDVSERSWQLERNGQWGKGKSFDTFTPLGPWLVTPDEVDNAKNLALTLSVNGVPRQIGNTEDMIFPVDTIVSYVSSFQTLHAGDVIITGTPAGVGMGMKPPVFLGGGDVIDMAITGLGTQKHHVVAR